MRTKPIVHDSRISGIEITPRDLSLFQTFDSMKRLRTYQIAALLGGSEQWWSRRLRRLEEAGFIERLTHELRYQFRVGGSESIIYQNAAGARRLVSGRRLKRPRDRIFVHHDLAVADFRISLALAAKADPNLTMMEAESVLSLSGATSTADDPLTLRAKVRFKGEGRERGSRPDDLLAVEFSDRKLGSNRLYYLPEIDMGTEPVAPRSLDRPSPLRKMLVYRAVWKNWQKPGAKLPLGFKHFQVPFVTSSEARLQSLLAANRQVVEGGSSMFLFATIDSIGVARRLHDLHGLQWKETCRKMREAGEAPGSTRWIQALSEKEEQAREIAGSLLKAPWIDGKGIRRTLVGGTRNDW